MKALTLILLFLTIALEAISEAMYDDGVKLWSKVIQSGIVISWFGILYFKKWSWWLPAIYMTERVLFFGIIYNLVRGLPHNYIGTTDWYDIYIAKYVMIAPVWFFILFGLIIMILKYSDNEKIKKNN